MSMKTLKIALKGKGKYLGMEKGCFIIRDKNGNVERYPLFENVIDEITVVSGNTVSTGALASCGFWGITVLVLTRRGEPVAVLRSIDDYSYVKTRIAQYEALKNGKGLEIAKKIVEARIKSQNLLLEKYDLKPHDLDSFKKKIEKVDSNSLSKARTRLLGIEGKATDSYYKQIFKLFPESVRIKKRFSWRAYDGINNTFNLAYTLLKYRVFVAVLRAHLEPYLGFLHSEQWSKPSLVCDLMELYRYLIEDLVIEFSQNLSQKDFVLKKEWYSSNRLAKRQVLNEKKTKELVEGIEELFQTKVEIPRIRYGYTQTLETLINEEAYLLAKYLRAERKVWKPRFPSLLLH